MSDYDDVVNSLRVIMSGVRYVNFRQATTGKLNADGSLNQNATERLPDGYIWVRFGEDRSAAVVKNMTMRNVAGVHVEVVYDSYHQEDQVWEVDRVRALEAMGAAAAAAMNVPEQGVYISTPISARDVTFLNLFPDSELGGLNVRITAGLLPSGVWWDGATTTTLVPTASGGKKSLVLVGIDPIALTYVTTQAVDRTLGEDLIADRELTEDGAADVKAVMDADPATVWIGAIELANGDTAIDASQIVSLPWRLPTMTGADGVDAGVAGLVPAPGATDNTKFLRGDGTYQAVVSSPLAADLDGGAQDITNLDRLELNEVSAPGTPASGKVSVYAKTDGKVYSKDDTGAETPLTRTIVRQTVFTFEAALSVVAGSIRIPNLMGEAFTITKVGLLVTTAPSGAAIIVDINKNGTTIFTNQAHRPQIASGANSGSTTSIDVSALADGDYLTMDIDQIGSTTPGGHLTVVVVFQ